MSGRVQIQISGDHNELDRRGLDASLNEFRAALERQGFTVLTKVEFTPRDRGEQDQRPDGVSGGEAPAPEPEPEGDEGEGEGDGESGAEGEGAEAGAEA